MRNCGAASVVVLQDNLFLSTDDDVNYPFYSCLQTYLRWVDFLRNCGAASVVVLQDNLFLSTDDDVNYPFYSCVLGCQAFEQE